MTLLDTNSEYDFEADKCRSLFRKKMSDYGTAWRILRLTSLIDQIYIKAARIRNIEEQKNQQIGDSVGAEYIGIVNYSLMSLIQIELGPSETCELDEQQILKLYDRHLSESKSLMQAKNHDYGEVWRQMQRSSLTDLILMKILRMKQILQNEGKTLVSEGVDANLQDMINYAIFALIKVSASDKTPVI